MQNNYGTVISESAGSGMLSCWIGGKVIVGPGYVFVVIQSVSKLTYSM
jgi:hypothetical protein